MVPLATRTSGRSPQSPHKTQSATVMLAHRHIDDPHLHALLALPAIDREVACRVHKAAAILEQRLAERLSGGADRDRVDDFPVAGFEARADVIFPDQVGIAK